MKVIDLDGNRSAWNLSGHKNNNRKVSSYHEKCRELLKQQFPTLQILEEVDFYPKKGSVQYFDFYIPLKHLAIEVHGEQHYKFSSLFHKSKLDLIKAKKKDSQKAEWCDVNGIDLIVLNYNEDIEQWKMKIV